MLSISSRRLVVVVVHHLDTVCSLRACGPSFSRLAASSTPFDSFCPIPVAARPGSGVKCDVGTSGRQPSVPARCASTMEEKTSSRRLTKRDRHPPIAYLNKSSNTNTLKRAPSAASYFAHSNLGAALPTVTTGTGTGTGTATAASSLSPATTPGSAPLRRSPSLTPVHEHHNAYHAYHAYQSANVEAATQYQLPPSVAHLPPAAVGQPFNSIVEDALNASNASNGSGPRRPAGPQHSQTDQPSRYLRPSRSFNTNMDTTTTTPPSTGNPKTNRYSDGSGEGAKKRLSGGAKKKGTFSTFMSSMLGSPRRPTISTPTNPMHVTHVSIDNQTGEYTVRRRTLILILLLSLLVSPPLTPL